MKKEKTYYRRDIMDKFKISRRVIEGYEEIGIVNPTGKTNMGIYQYDEKTFKRIGFIRLCQKMGFEVKEIKTGTWDYIKGIFGSDKVIFECVS